MTTPAPIPAEAALQRLREGNERFVSNVRSLDSLLSHTRRTELIDVQNPVAIVLGCSDSRVSLEMVFDQGLGDLFVIRVAGNIVAPSQIGSIEFAAARFGTRLVVVLGHTQCSAILTTIQHIRGECDLDHSSVRSIVDRIRPSVQDLIDDEWERDDEALVREAVRANVTFSTNHLRHGSPILKLLIAESGLMKA